MWHDGTARLAHSPIRTPPHMPTMLASGSPPRLCLAHVASNHPVYRGGGVRTLADALPLFIHAVVVVDILMFSYGYSYGYSCWYILMGILMGSCAYSYVHSSCILMITLVSVKQVAQMRCHVVYTLPCTLPCTHYSYILPVHIAHTHRPYTWLCTHTLYWPPTSSQPTVHSASLSLYGARHTHARIADLCIQSCPIV